MMFGGKKDDTATAAVNHKLQAALEETILQNTKLQKEIDRISSDLSRVSQEYRSLKAHSQVVDEESDSLSSSSSSSSSSSLSPSDHHDHSDHHDQPHEDSL